MKRFLISAALLLLATAAFAQMVPGRGQMVPGTCGGFVSMMVPGCSPLVPNAATGGGGGACSNGSVDLSTTCGVLTFAAMGLI